MVSMSIWECAEAFRKGKPTNVHKEHNLRLKMYTT